MRPAPVQQPHPPLFIGGYADAALHRAVKYGAGYLGGNMPFDTIVDVLDRLNRYAEEAGRDPRDMQLVCRGVTRLSDTLDQVVENVQRYADAGVTELFLDLNFDPAVGSVDADANASTDRALAILEALAPSA
jgi:alkanesulfonate monooxygenase SsuD/methylene tetrahydromethanopterin reductase-like flavin-dependent oxidoreductase (luciferase family)